MTAVLVHDATHSNIDSLPSGLAAGYVTGSPDIMWTETDWSNHPQAVRIDQSPTLTSLDETADVLDVENGAATNAEAADWFRAALSNYNNHVRPGQRYPAIYTSKNNVTALVNALNSAGVTSGPRLWVADWTNNASEAQQTATSGSGPFPIIGQQYENNGNYDSSYFDSNWLNTVSGVKIVTYSVETLPPGEWEGQINLHGTGTDGQEWHTTTSDGKNWSTPTPGS